MTNFRMTNRQMMRDPDYLAVRNRFWTPTPLRATCPECGVVFPILATNQKYCTDSCTRRVQRRRAKDAVKDNRHIGEAIKRMKAEGRAA
jgi:hypothetical protein